MSAGARKRHAGSAPAEAGSAAGGRGLALSRYRLALFDCDGVILDSNPLKTAAYRQTLAGEPEELIEAFLAFHHERGGLPRNAKLAYFYRELAREAGAEAKVEAALARFSTITREGLAACPEVAGVRAFIARLEALGIPAMVLSGGTEGEVVDALTAKGLTPFFARVLGGPTAKETHLADLEAEGALARPALFFGDSRVDLEAAQGFGLDFVFVARHSEWKEGRERATAAGFPVIEDFRDLL